MLTGWPNPPTFWSCRASPAGASSVPAPAWTSSSRGINPPMAEQRPLQGRKLGDRRVVVDRPHARYFRYLGPGVLEAKLEAQAPRTGYQRRMATIRGALFGRPLSLSLIHISEPTRPY